MEKKLRSLLLQTLGTESYLGLVSSTYIRLIQAGFLKSKYPELFYLKELIMPGFVCVDIGANVGYYSVFLSQYAGKMGAVHAIEPVPIFGNVFLKKKAGHKKIGDKVGGLNAEGYITTSISFNGYVFAVNLNKIVFCLHNGRWAKKGNKVDHKNGISTDNRPCNLRESTNSQNASNKSVSGRNKLGAKGVCAYNVSDDTVRVVASVSFKKETYTKSMNVKKEFVEATVQILKAWRDEKAQKLHGEFFNAG